MQKLTLEYLRSRIGKEIGLSAWLQMTQDRIQAFADCTEDRQWIHVDVERARKSPLRSTVSHGYLLLSLLAHFNYQYEIFQRKVRMAVNYGLNRVRFIHPVRPGERIRNRAVLKSVEKQGLRKVLIEVENTLEIENVKNPALVADVLALIYL